MRTAIADALLHEMAKNGKIIVLYADTPPEKLDELKENFGHRVINFGIAESNMVGASAAMAKEGFIPLVFSMCTFIVYRPLEFIRTDICLQQRNVKLLGLSCGVIMNNFGPTHHATEDIAALRALPNLVILSPASVKEVAPVLEAAITHEGPVYIRLGKAFEKEIYEEPPEFQIGKANIIQGGDDITVIATGSIIADAVEAAKKLGDEGIRAEIINMSTIKPLDTGVVIKSAKKTGRVVTVEEHTMYGGLGSAVCECLMQAGIHAAYAPVAINDVFCTEYGYHRDLKRALGLSPEHIYMKCKSLL